MFFRRNKPVHESFEQRVGTLKGLGFTVESAAKDGYKISRSGYAAHLIDVDGKPMYAKPGMLIAGEVALLTSAGYQMFFVTPSGVTRPAQAEQLKTLHNFTEDLAEALGENCLYNQGLGTTTESHLYDRVENRDHGVPHRAWEK